MRRAASAALVTLCWVHLLVVCAPASAQERAPQFPPVAEIARRMGALMFLVNCHCPDEVAIQRIGQRLASARH